MATSRSTGAPFRSVALVVVIMVTSLLVMSAEAGKGHRSPCSRKPTKLVLYEHVVIGNTTATTTRLITDSPLGQLFVLAEPTTFGKSLASRRVGTTYGANTFLTGGAGSDTQFFAFDFHIKGKLAVNGSKKLVQFDGTIITIGASSASSPAIPILGGTGDFLGAKGFLTGTLVAGSGDPTATYKQEFTIWCERPDQLS